MDWQKEWEENQQNGGNGEVSMLKGEKLEKSVGRMNKTDQTTQNKKMVLIL